LVCYYLIEDHFGLNSPRVAERSPAARAYVTCEPSSHYYQSGTQGDPASTPLRGALGRQEAQAKPNHQSTWTAGGGRLGKKMGVVTVMP
jgi:hypothetical protein